MVPEDTSKHEDDFYQIQRSYGTPSTGPRSRITSAQAQEAVEMAARFVAAVTALIEP
jgi:hypothetical protein